MLKVNVGNEIIPWTEFKKRLLESEQQNFRIQFKVDLPKREPKQRIVTAQQYTQILNRRSELAEMRAEWQEFRRESVWLVNAMFAAAGVGFCAFFVTYSYDFGVVSFAMKVAVVLF